MDRKNVNQQINWRTNNATLTSVFVTTNYHNLKPINNMKKINIL